MSVRLYFWQRVTAVLLAPMVVVHLGLILYVIHYRLTAAEILSRTRGSFGWGAFYTVFVLLAAVHAAIGIRNIVHEWGRLKAGSAAATAALLGILLVILGLRAVAAVVLP